LCDSLLYSAKASDGTKHKLSHGITSKKNSFLNANALHSMPYNDMTQHAPSND